MTRLVVAPDGSIVTLYDEDLDLSALGILRVERAGRVEPDAEGRWTADLAPSGGPVLGPFARRSEALAAEVAWLLSHRLRGAETT